MITNLKNVNEQLQGVKVVAGEGMVSLSNGTETIVLVKDATPEFVSMFSDTVSKALNTTIGKLVRKNQTAIRKELTSELKSMAKPRQKRTTAETPASDTPADDATSATPETSAETQVEAETPVQA